MRFAAIAIALALAMSVGACGEAEDRGATTFVPAAGGNTPPDTTPGVPPSSSYAVSGNEWLKLSDEERLTAARDYVAGHPDECENTDGRAAAAAVVRDWADVSIGTDFPLNEPIAELLAEGCAAALQSDAPESP